MEKRTGFAILNPYKNKRTNQTIFTLRMKELPKELRNKKIKPLKIKLDSFKFEDEFEEKWK